jgi:hypothetical protein
VEDTAGTMAIPAFAAAGIAIRRPSGCQLGRRGHPGARVRSLLTRQLRISQPRLHAKGQYGYAERKKPPHDDYRASNS